MQQSKKYNNKKTNILVYCIIFLIIFNFFEIKTVFCATTHYECPNGGTLYGSNCIVKDCGNKSCSCSNGTLTCYGGSSSGCSHYICTIPATAVNNYACYACGTRGQNKYWGSYTNYGQKDCVRTNDTFETCEQDKCDGNKYTVTFNAGEGVISGTNAQTKTLTANVLIHTNGQCFISQDLISKFRENEPTAIPNDNTMEFRYWSAGGTGGYSLPIHSNITVYARYRKKTPTTANYNNLSNDNGDSSSSSRNIYKITYNPNGGHFINGSTEDRITYIPSNHAIGDPKTNPIKDGYKFKEWQLDGTKFDFSQKPTKDVTLTAIYEKLTEEDKEYKCDDDYIYEPTDKLCYRVLKPDNTNTFDYTLYKYETGTRQCNVDNSSIQFVSSANPTAEGKQNNQYEGYNEQESWVTEDTCLIGTSCSESENINQTACQTKWNAIIYSSKQAISKSAVDTSQLLDIEKESAEDNSRKSDNEAGEMGPTGDALIYIIFALGLGSLGYTVYYFQKKKKMANI